jgi:hypothetical protein
MSPGMQWPQSFALVNKATGMIAVSMGSVLVPQAPTASFDEMNTWQVNALGNNQYSIMPLGNASSALTSPNTAGTPASLSNWLGAYYANSWNLIAVIQ